MTVCSPLIEPTPIKSKHSLDAFTVMMRDLVHQAKTHAAEHCYIAPIHSPQRRIDEADADRHLTLRRKPMAQTKAETEQAHDSKAGLRRTLSQAP